MSQENQAIETEPTEEWTRVTNIEKLREFIGGLKFDRPLVRKNIAKVEFFADGTSTLRTWGKTFHRTWELSDNAEVCLTTDKQINCYYFERNNLKPGLFRAYSEKENKYVELHITDGRSISGVTYSQTTSKGSAGSVSASEMAAELSNPNTPVAILNTNFDYKQFSGNIPGASDQSGFSILFQPSIPYPLGKGKNLFIRPSIPIIIDQPVFNTTLNEFESKGTELGDIGLDTTVGFTFDADGGKNIMLVGASWVFPTADDEIGQDQWQAGPFFGGSMIRKWGSVAVFASQLVDIGGDQSFDTNITSGQYFYSINLDDGWQIIGTPTWFYDHEASSGNAASFPLAVGIAKTVIINNRPWQFTLEYWDYIVSPDDFGVDKQIRITIGPVVDLPWE